MTKKCILKHKSKKHSLELEYCLLSYLNSFYFCRETFGKWLKDSDFLRGEFTSWQCFSASQENEMQIFSSSDNKGFKNTKLVVKEFLKYCLKM